MKFRALIAYKNVDNEKKTFCLLYLKTLLCTFILTHSVNGSVNEFWFKKYLQNYSQQLRSYTTATNTAQLIFVHFASNPLSRLISS